jgi:hypothetical protein
MAKSTNAEIERRVSDIYPLVVSGLPSRDIRRYVTDKCDWTADQRTIERYMAKARAIIHEKADYDRTEKLSEALAFLEDVRGRSAAKGNDRVAIAAQRELNDLLGLKEPARVEQSGELRVIVDYADANDTPDAA